MLPTVGIVITAILLIFTMIAAWQKRIGGGEIVAFGFISITAGAVIANYSRLDSIAVHPDSLDVKMHEVKEVAKQVDTKAQQVQTDTAEVRQMKEQIEALVKRVDQGEKTVSQIHSAVAEADKKLTTVQKQQAPRRLTNEQQQSLIASLSPFKGQKVSVACILGNGDGKQLAEDFVTVFSHAGWDLGPEPGVQLGTYTQDPVGMNRVYSWGRTPKTLLGLKLPLTKMK